MKKNNWRIILPLLVITVLNIHCWTVILTTNILATWRQYLGLLLFLVLIAVFFKNRSTAIVGTGVYLLLATFNIVAITPEIKVGWFAIGPVSTPPLQMLSLIIFAGYFVLNLDALIAMRLDYIEARQKKAGDPN